MQVTTDSVGDIGRSLRFAREQAHLSVGEAAERAGLTRAEAEALESGVVDRLRDRVETLRSLRTYAASFGLPGNDYVLAYVDLWPSHEAHGTRPSDSGPVPVVSSVTAAPAGGHSPSSNGGWLGDRTGANGFSVTGVVSPVGGTPGVELASSTTVAGTDAASADAAASTEGEEPAVDTGEIKVRMAPPRMLKVLVAAAAVLVAAGVFTLTEHTHFSAWHTSLQADSTRWFNDLKVDTGISPKPKATASAAPSALPKVTIVTSPSGSAVTMNVAVSSFSVKMVAFKTSSWMQVTDSSQQSPIYQQVLAGGGNVTFPVTHSLTVETGSASARAYVYEGTTFIGYYFPAKAPFTMTFTATG